MTLRDTPPSTLNEMSALLDGRTDAGISSAGTGTTKVVPETTKDEKVGIDAVLSLSLLRNAAKNELIDIIDSLRGIKCLVVQSELGGLLNQVMVDGSKALKDIGVQYFRELKGDLGSFGGTGSSRSVPDNIIYIVRPSLPVMKAVAHQINTSSKAGLRCQYHVYFVPFRTVACEQILEDEGVLDMCEIGEFNLGFVPLESDVLSLELEEVFRQCYVDGDTSSLSVVAQALYGLQELYGLIPNIKAKGAASRKILQTLMHLRCERNGGTSAGGDTKSSAGTEAWWELATSRSGAISTSNLGSSVNAGKPAVIDSLVVLDREVDLISPLVTPLTYEGLLDELIGVELGKLKLDKALLGDVKDINVKELTGGRATNDMLQTSTQAQEQEETWERAPQSGVSNTTGAEKVTIMLNNTDVVFCAIRNLSIERLGAFLQEQAIKIKQRYTAFRDNKDASIAEIHQFVKNLPALTKEYKCLHQHINIAELLKRTTDGALFRDQWQTERAILEGELCIDWIEDLVCADVQRSQLYKVLRLMCLQSITAGGIRSNRYDGLRRLVVQTYGFQHLFLITNLEKAGLLRRKDLMLVDTAPSWPTIRNQLQLIESSATAAADSADRSKASRTGISYVSAGYAPLSARVVQRIGEGNNGWQSMQEVLRLLPGPMLEFNQLRSRPEELADALRRAASDAAAAVGQAPASADEGTAKKVMLVLYVGGVSYLEVAALRHLSADPNYPYQIVVASTKLCNGGALLKAAASPGLCV